MLKQKGAFDYPKRQYVSVEELLRFAYKLTADREEANDLL